MLVTYFSYACFYITSHSHSTSSPQLTLSSSPTKERESSHIFRERQLYSQMSMEKHKCKLCSREFSSGKAMGGHMRSHLMTLPLPPKTPPQKLDSGGGGGRNSESTLSVYSMKDEEEIREENCLGLRENPKKSSTSVDPEFLDAGSSVLHDRESETESTKKPTRRRSKRIRRMFIAEVVEENHHGREIVEIKKEKSGEFEPVSSFSDTSPEEDIAICLMMLSKDVWKSSYESEESKFSEKQGKYQCEICNKVLKSSQALGSHKTIHKKNNSDESSSQEKLRKSRVKKADQQKVHECPFCGKIYGSGQALGGHKRSHILSSSITVSSSSKLGESLMDSSTGKFANGFIDLNMPAPMEDEDFSQPEVSGVS